VTSEERSRDPLFTVGLAVEAESSPVTLKYTTTTATATTTTAMTIVVVGHGAMAAMAARDSAARAPLITSHTKFPRSEPSTPLRSHPGHRTWYHRGSAPTSVCSGAAGAAGAPLRPIQAASLDDSGEAKTSFLAAFWKFLRPHTIRGTILGSLAVTSKAIMENPAAIDWGLLPRAMLGVLALLCGNGYIVGINQIYDVEIDAVNKPYLPVAAGELGFTQAWVICVVLAAAGLGITTFNFGSLIAKLYAFGLFLGTIYSVRCMNCCWEGGVGTNGEG